MDETLSLTSASYWDYPILDSWSDTIQGVDRTFESEDGVIAILEDGTRINVSKVLSSSIVNRVNLFLEEVLGGNESLFPAGDSELLDTFNRLNTILSLSKQELDLAGERLHFAERILHGRASGVDNNLPRTSLDDQQGTQLASSR